MPEPGTGINLSIIILITTMAQLCVVLTQVTAHNVLY